MQNTRSDPIKLQLEQQKHLQNMHATLENPKTQKLKPRTWIKAETRGMKSKSMQVENVWHIHYDTHNDIFTCNKYSHHSSIINNNSTHAINLIINHQE